MVGARLARQLRHENARRERKFLRPVRPARLECAPRRLHVKRDRMNSTRDPDEDEEGDRRLANIVLAIGFVLLVGGGIWLANAMIDARKADECMSSGRRNCNPIEGAPRGHDRKCEAARRLCRAGNSRSGMALAEGKRKRTVRSTARGQPEAIGTAPAGDRIRVADRSKR